MHEQEHGAVFVKESFWIFDGNFGFCEGRSDGWHGWPGIRMERVSRVAFYT